MKRSSHKVAKNSVLFVFLYAALVLSLDAKYYIFLENSCSEFVEIAETKKLFSCINHDARCTPWVSVCAVWNQCSVKHPICERIECKTSKYGPKKNTIRILVNTKKKSTATTTKNHTYFCGRKQEHQFRTTVKC